MAQRTHDGGRTWRPFLHWSLDGFNEIISLPNGSFIMLPYSLDVNYATNTSATSTARGRAHLDAETGEFVWEAKSLPQKWLTTTDDPWPDRLVHSGSVVILRDGSLLSTCYGHGAGTYRKWTKRSAVYFVRSVDMGTTWVRLATVPWQVAYGDSADGPGEPTTARLADGRLMCVFRADSTTPYWTVLSSDEGRTWSAPRKLDLAWSVKPRLRLTTRGVLVLTGGRPGIFLWASADGGESWRMWNLAREHNTLINAGALAANYSYDAQVVNVSGPTTPRAKPEPQTSSYTGLAEAADGAVVVSYDRIANGWKGPPGVWGDCDTLFTMRIRLGVQ